MPIEFLKRVAIKMIQVREAPAEARATLTSRCCRATSPSGSAATVRSLSLTSPILRETDGSALHTVDKSSDTFNGVMDMRLFEYDEAFGTTVKMDKKERLMIYESSMTQCVVSIAVRRRSGSTNSRSQRHDVHGRPPRRPRQPRPLARRELLGAIRFYSLPPPALRQLCRSLTHAGRSQGKDACNKGFLVMTDDWFSNYVYQIVAPRSFLSHELLDIYDDAPVTVLPPWDVLGT